MKKIFLIISAAVFLLAGCTKEQLVEERSYTGPVTVVGATFEKFSEDEATKASVTDAGNFSWQVDDQAAFTESSSTAYCLGTNAVAGLNAQFGIEGTHTFSSSSWALYPYDLTTGQSPATLKVKVPASREWKEGQTNVAMYGVKKTSTPVFDFSHMGGLVRVRVNNVPTNAREFVFQTTGCKINGEFAVTEDGGKKIISTGTPGTGEDTYTLTWASAPAVENHMDFYIPLPVGSYAGGFAFYLKDGEHNTLYKKVGTTPQTVARRQLLLMPPITLMGGAIETAEKAAVAVEIPAGYSGDYLLPQTEKVLLKINASSGDHDITLKYDGVELPTYLEIHVIGDDENYNAILAGNLPQTHVAFTSGHIDHTSLTTSSSTLAVINPATVGTLTVKGGNVLVQGESVTNIIVDEAAVASEETQAPVQIVVEKSEAETPVYPTIIANANVVVAPAENVTVTVTVPAAVQEQVQVANGGAGTVKDESGNEIETKATAKIGDIQYFTLADAIAAVKDNETITMIADVTDANGISVPSGKNFTVDFREHTYTCLDNPTGSTNTTNQVFQLNAGNTITFKNGTIKVAETNKTKFRFIIQNYADLTLEDMTLDGTNLGIDNSRYTLSNNAGNINLTGNTTIKAAAENGVAFDIYYWPEGGYSTAPVLTWSSTGTVEGRIELAGASFIVEKDLKLTTPIRTTENANGTATLTVKSGATISPKEKFKANVHTQFTGTGATFNEYAGGVVIVNRGADLKINGAGTITTTNNEEWCYAAVCLTEKKESEAEGAAYAKLTVEGTVKLEGYYYGICGNGNRHNTEITINGGTIKGTADNDNIGIYHPQAGLLTINGGAIEGSTGIVLKGGKLVVNDGTIIGNGVSATFSHNGSGWNNTGDALAVEVCDYPGQNPPQTDLSAEIKGGKFASTNGKPVASYVQPNKSYTPLAGFIFGGLYNKAPEAGYIALGKKAELNGAGLWKIVADPTFYVIEEMTAEMVIPEGITHVVASDELAAARLAAEPWMSEDDARNPFFMDNTVTKVSLPASMTPVSGLFYNTRALKEVEFDGSGNLVFENVPIVNSYYVEKITIKNLPETCQFYNVNDNSKPNQYLINLDTPKSDGPKKIEIFLPAGWIEKGYQYKFNSCCATPIYTYEDGKLIGYCKDAKWYTVTEVNENGVQSITASEDGKNQTAIVYAAENTVIPHGVTDLQSNEDLMNDPGRTYDQDWPFVQNQTVKSVWIPSTILVKENGKQDFNGAFQHCDNLESITLEGGNDMIYTSFPMIAWCKSIKTVKIDRLPADFKFQYGVNNNSAVNNYFIYADGAGMPDATIMVYLPNGWKNSGYQYKFGAQMDKGIPTIKVYEADTEGNYQYLGKSVNNVWQDPE